MIGMTFRVRGARIKGTVDATSVDPAGTAMVRIKDRWFDVALLVPV